jgi:hypothetical protein
MRALLRDGLFALSLAVAIGTTALTFSLLNVAAALPHKIDGGLVHRKDSSLKQPRRQSRRRAASVREVDKDAQGHVGELTPTLRR